MSRRASETYEYDKVPLPANKPTSLERNCGQIFSRGPALTRDIFERMQKDRRQIMGYEIETKQLWLLSGLLLLFLSSLAGMVAMWFTDAFDNMVFQNMAITPGSRSYEMWAKPSPRPLLKVYIFNYTNVPEFESKDAEKLNVKELGPFVYEVALERLNVKFNGSKLSYQEQRIFKFMPDLSIGRKQNDRVIVPNIPLFTAAALNKHSAFLARMGVSGVLNSLNAKPFIGLPAHRFIMGYEDNLYALAKSYMRFQNKKPYDRFGLVYSTVGISDVITINTGANDINKIGLIDKFNSESTLEQWSTDECNDLSESTDGTLFPPKLVRNKRPVSIYMKDMCRTIPLRFQKEVTILNGRIPAYRYSLPEEIFDDPDHTPSNQCYCDLDLGACPPHGVFNATPCSFGAPIFLSRPHFYQADPALRDGVTGLDPKPTYETYADLHPTLGYVMAGKNRVQVNVQVAKAFGISQVNMFEDGLMLPVAWLEYGLEDKTLPDDMVSVIFQTTFTLKTIEVGLKYGCLLSMGVTLFGILMVLRNRWTKRARTSSIRPLQTTEDRV